MKSLEQLNQDLVTAHEAGDFELARHIAGLIKQQEGGMEHPPAQEPPFEEPLKQVAQKTAAAGTGIMRGLSSVLGLPLEMPVLPIQAYRIATQQGAPLPKLPSGGKDIRDIVSEITGRTLYEPQDTLEKYLAAGGETAASMLPGNAKQALTGIVAGLTGEAAHNAMPNEWSRLVGTTIPLLATMYPGLRRPNEVRAVKSFVDELGPEGMRTADAVRKAAAAKLATPTLLSQGSPQTELTGVVEALANAPEGGELRKVLRDQLIAGEREAGKLTAGLPGGRGQDEANKILTAGNDIVGATKQGIRNDTRAAYEAAAGETVDPAMLQAAIEGIKAREGFLPGSAPARVVEKAAGGVGQAAEAAKGTPPRIIESPVLGPDGKPITTTVPGKAPTPTTAVDLSTSFKQPAQVAAAQAKKADARTKDVQNKAANEAVAGTIKDFIAPEGSAMKAADDLYSALAKERLDPLEKGAFSTLFPKAKRIEGKGDWDSFISAFDKLAAEDVAKVGQTMRKHGKNEEFLSLVRESTQRKIEAALQPTAGRTAENAFNTLANELAGPQATAKRLAFEQQQYEVALAKGLTPQEARLAAQGAGDLIDAFYLISRDRGGTAAGGAQSIQAAKQNWFTRLLKAASFTAPLRGFGYGMEENARRVLANDLIKGLTTEPERLIAIAKYSHRGQQAKNIARGLSALENAAQRE